MPVLAGIGAHGIGVGAAVGVHGEQTVVGVGVRGVGLKAVVVAGARRDRRVGARHQETGVRGAASVRHRHIDCGGRSRVARRVAGARTQRVGAIGSRRRIPGNAVGRYGIRRAERCPVQQELHARHPDIVAGVGRHCHR